MIKKSTFFLLVCAGLMSACSPVKFSAKSTNPNPTATPTSDCTVTNTCVPPDDGTSVWRTGTYGICSQSCGGGTQSRTVACVNKNNEAVPEDRCKEAKPASTQACNAQACNGTPAWNKGDWDDCSATCGGGNQKRTVECRDSSGVKPDSSCTEEKPATVQTCNTQVCACTPTNKNLSLTVPANTNKVDILLVLDDSSSMAVDNTKLAERLNGFVTDLHTNNLDWQMCVTTTDVNYYEGRAIEWTGTGNYLLTKNVANLSTVFQQTIYDIGSGYGNDEQGIKASIYSMLNNPLQPCYRANSAHAVIIISDEDERSVGGNSALSSQQYQPLTLQNYPSTFVSTAKALFGSNLKLLVNSVVVQDNQCKQAQDPQGSPAFIGLKYMELANLTNGTVGNICDTDYSANLKYFKDTIISTVGSVDLECTPAGTPTVTLPTGYTWVMSGKKMTFTPALATGVTLTVNYACCP